jgi:sensor histidine kinase regulating citrate/malate metabolism
MIDNAIENYYSEGKDTIVVRIMKQNDFIRFIVSNPVNLEKINLRSLTKTSKTGRGHGYGTKIIKNIASAYNGYVDFGIEENRFVCDAVLNLNTKELDD